MAEPALPLLPQCTTPVDSSLATSATPVCWLMRIKCLTTTTRFSINTSSRSNSAPQAPYQRRKFYQFITVSTIITTLGKAAELLLPIEFLAFPVRTCKTLISPFIVTICTNKSNRNLSSRPQQCSRTRQSLRQAPPTQPLIYSQYRQRIRRARPR